MTMKELRSVRSRKMAIETKKEQIIRLRSAMEGMTQTLTFAPGGGVPQTLEDKMIKLLDLEDDLATQIIVLEYTIRDIEQWIDSLPTNEAIVMRMRYIDGLPWRKVAKQTNYTIDNCKRINSKCIKTIHQNTPLDVL